MPISPCEELSYIAGIVQLNIDKMKKITLLLFAAFLFAGIAANAQSQGEIRVGLGLALGTEAGVDENSGGSELGLGINFGGEYLVTDVIGIAPSYTSFFKTDFDSGIGSVSVGFNAFNVDGRYYFTTDDAQVYGLLGFTSMSAKSSFGGISTSSSEGGLNIGGGVNIPFNDSLLGNLQVKYQSPFEGQLVVNFGVAYVVNN